MIPRPRPDEELTPTAFMGIRLAGGERPWRPAPRWVVRIRAWLTRGV